jgi:hypothetical protein
MSIARRLRTIACCAILEVGTLMGVPMRPEQIQDLMRAMNVPKLAQTNPDESSTGDGHDPEASGVGAPEAEA